jgi:hypothetical protein
LVTDQQEQQIQVVEVVEYLEHEPQLDIIDDLE